MDLCQPEFEWFLEFSRGDAARATEIAVVAKDASELSSRSMMRVAYPLDDFFDRSAAYDRSGDLPGNMFSATLTNPRAHYDAWPCDWTFIGTMLMPAS